MERVHPGSHHFEYRLAHDTLAPGEYQYKYIVDGQWRCADDQDKVRDEHGNQNNQIVIPVPQ